MMQSTEDWLGGDPRTDQLASTVLNNEEDVECSKPECLNGEEVAGADS